MSVMINKYYKEIIDLILDLHHSELQYSKAWALYENFWFGI